MTRKNAIGLYLLGTLGQIGIVCIAVFILRKIGLIVDYTTPAGLAAIALGGLSSAVWGTIVAVKYKKYDVKKILKDFFQCKAKNSPLCPGSFVPIPGFSVCSISG